MGEKGDLDHSFLPKGSPEQLLEGVELLPDHGGEPGGVAPEEEQERVHLPEAPDHVPNLPGEHAAPVLGVLQPLGVYGGYLQHFAWRSNVAK